MNALSKESQPIPPRTCSILGSEIAITTYAEAVSLARTWAALRDRPYAIAAANTHVVTLARRDPAFKEALERFDLLLPDGMPLIWCIRRFAKERLEDRVYGPTFMLKCLEAAQGSHFFLGGSEALLASLRSRLVEKFPNMAVAGSYAPPFGDWDEAEEERILEWLQAARADFIWVAFGCPKQEMWIARNKARLPPGVYGAVGAAFAFHAGWVAQAPAWMQNAGMEWAFRLATEPRRLWKRYLVNNTLFIFHLLKDAFFKPKGNG
jgi:N-acetylglucosaminyldiphosphoundecaprenol N-acetyl-beta-D-mannosaminyltransferase